MPDRMWVVGGLAALFPGVLLQPAVSTLLPGPEASLAASVRVSLSAAMADMPVTLHPAAITTYLPVLVGLVVARYLFLVIVYRRRRATVSERALRVLSRSRRARRH